MNTEKYIEELKKQITLRDEIIASQVKTIELYEAFIKEFNSGLVKTTLKK